ncbi:hypothetical protein C439_09415 [Haloferax mediterranei ATCC 33500]|nr:hypothetical protein BM92_08300 [Haloferax mediterranei ATCC 33500]EMA02790.1 hypothetical protein C439_09415 [Haloferax mediterranei ATCC 33500]
MLAVLAAGTSGCVGQVLETRPKVAMTGVRLHNWTEYPATVQLKLFRESQLVLDEEVSLGPLSSEDSSSVASFTPDWSVEPAHYRLQLAEADSEASLDRRLPPEDYAWDGCSYIDADIENGRGPYRKPGPDAPKWFEMHLQTVIEDSFSTEYCPDQ